MRRATCLFLLLISWICDAAMALPPGVMVSSDSPERSGKLVEILGQVGVKAYAGELNEGSMADADVLVLHRDGFEPISPEARAAIGNFAKRGGGIVALHGAIAAGDPAWLKPIIGAAWTADSRKFSSLMMLYVATGQHPIVNRASPFDIEDETLYDLDRAENIQVLASAFTPKLSDRTDDKRPPAQPDRAAIFDIQPQMWTYEGSVDGGKSHRAFVMLQGAAPVFEHASFRTFLRRGVAWTAGREDLDEFSNAADVESLRYPAGGPRRAQDTVEQLQVEPGFEVSVVASEPLVNKPIAVQWDAAGRLWVAETPEYPNGRREAVAPAWRETGVLKPEKFDRPAEDRISILSEPDDQGKFTVKTVFADGLELVTGFCLYRDGVIALHQPDILWLRDTDGDGVADKTERIFTGFAPGDTHFVANHLIAAPDGWIYASMGGGAEARNPETNEVMAQISSGMLRFKPDGSAIEQVSSKGGNGFGADFTSDGELFFGQATTGNPVQHVALPEKTLALGKVGGAGGALSVIEQRKVAVSQLPQRASLMQIDVVGGYSAACSSLVYEGGAFPAEWNDSVFCTEPILNIIHREKLQPAGPTFSGEMARTEAEFIRSPEDYWFRPIDVTTGADGALYLLDFYNPVIAHNDTRGPLHSRSGASVRPDREHYFGRIYRVQHKDSTKLKVPDLTKADLAGKISALSHPNRLVRFNAQRLLIEAADPQTAAALLPVARESASLPARILSLWGLQRLGTMPDDLLIASLKDVAPEICKTAALIVEEGANNAAQAALAEGITDADPRARIAMLRGLASTALTEQSAAALVALYPTLTDDLTRSAAVAAASSNRPALLRATLAAPNPGELIQVAANVANVLVEQNDAGAFAALLPAIANAPTTADPVRMLLLEKAALVKTRPTQAVDAGVLKPLLDSPDPALRAATLPIAMNWSDPAALAPAVATISSELLNQLKQDDVPEDQRIRAAESLVAAHTANPAILPAIGALLVDGSVPIGVRTAAIEALRRSEDPAVGGLLVENFNALEQTLQAAAFDILLSRVEWVTGFLAAAGQKKVALNQLGPNDVFRLRSHPVKAISDGAKVLLNELHKPNADKEELIASLLPTVTQPGDRENGKLLFSQMCATCHQLGGDGKQIGPVLDGIGAHGPEQLLVSIVDPNRQIDAGYELFNIETNEGSYHAGILAQQNEARVILRSMAGDEEIPVNRIKNRTNTRRSLMPEGLEAVGAENLRDIIAYICGDQSRYRVVNLRRNTTGDAREGLFIRREAMFDSLRFNKYGLVQAGEIPFEIIDPATNSYGGNVIVLQSGGPDTLARTMPKTVEIPVGHAAEAFHFLGGIAGWGAQKPDPNGGEIMKVTYVFADGETETTVLRNGVEFADFPRRFDVPGSKFVKGIMRDQQIRRFTIPVKHGGVVEKIVMESPGGGAAPVTVGITADLGE